MNAATSIIAIEGVNTVIHHIRGHRVLLDSDLAGLYQVNIKALNQAVKRNIARFPADFMFQLTREEAASLRSHSVTLKKARGTHRKYQPSAFTEQGVAMLSSVLRSPRAVQVNIEMMRAFVRLRALVMTSEDLERKLDQVEKKYDRRFRIVFDAIRKLMEPDEPDPKPTRGFGR